MSDTFSRLERNIEINNLKNVTAIKNGLWSHATRLKGDCSFRDGKDWSFRLVDALPNEKALIDAVSVPDIVQKYNLDRIDFIKIDIEGGEAEVFKNDANLDWLKLVKVIAIEIHPEFECRKTIEQSLIYYGFDLSWTEELTIGVNQNM